MIRLLALWLWFWTEAAAVVAASVLPARDADRAEAWCLRRRRIAARWKPPTAAVVAEEGDTPASVAARRAALIRLCREFHKPAR